MTVRARAANTKYKLKKVYIACWFGNELRVGILATVMFAYSADLTGRFTSVALACGGIRSLNQVDQSIFGCSM